MIIQHNMMAMYANRQLKTENKRNMTTMERLSSGYRINRAADDAAGLAISEKMRAQIRGMNRAYKNTQEGILMAETADGALHEVTAQLQRMRELAVMTANGIYTDDDRSLTQQEIEQLTMEIDDITEYTEFNTIKVFRPNPSDETTTSYKMLDVAFCIDTTGSMGGMIRNVRENIDVFVDALKAMGVNPKIGLVEYKDVRDDGAAAGLKIDRYYDTTEEFKAALARISPTGGGDEPESGLEAIIDGALRMEGRPDTAKHVILVTDASIHTTADGKSVYSLDDAAAALKAAKAGLTIIGAGPLIEGTGQLKQLADKAGGSCLNIERDFAGDLLALAEGISLSLEGEDVTHRWLQTGPNEGMGMWFPINVITANLLGIEDVSVETQQGASHAITKMDSALRMISKYRAEYGAIQNRLEHTLSNLANSEENLTAAESAIRDADMAYEVMIMAKSNILLQSSQSMLAQANSSMEGILKLLQE